jgi:Domain of unknown function (DUF6456)
MSRAVERARGLLARPGAWLDGGEDGYRLRLRPDRRARPALTLDEPAFRALVDQPGLRLRQGGGWMAREAARPEVPAFAGRPGMVEGVRPVVTPDGVLASRRANLAQSPIAWLAARRDASGAPLLTPAQAAAGARLTLDAERAQAGPALTMRWDALPRSGAGGRTRRSEPTDPALAAGRRVAEALAAVGPRHRAVLDWICVRGSALAVAEQGLGLKRRTGKQALREALQALGEHYGAG